VNRIAGIALLAGLTIAYAVIKRGKRDVVR
jgi:hypothetical protein